MRLIHDWRVQRRIMRGEPEPEQKRLKHEASLNSFADDEMRQLSAQTNPADYDPRIRGVLYYTIVTLLYAVTTVIAIIVQDLGPIFNILGAVSSNALTFLLPCIYYLRLTKKKSGVNIIACWFIIVIAGGVGILCIVSQQIVSARK